MPKRRPDLGPAVQACHNSQAEAEAQEEEAELGEDDDGLDHPHQVEDDVLVQDLEEVDAREAASPEPPPAQRGGQCLDAQRPPRRRRRRLPLPAPPGRGRHPHLLLQPLLLPPAGHGGWGRPADRLWRSLGYDMRVVETRRQKG